MADEKRPDETTRSGSGENASAGVRQDELDRRRADLAAALAARRPAQGGKEKGDRSSASAGYSYALKLSSEFIAGILVGAALGWSIDYLAGTSPWGMIVFLLLGFCAGVLNILRSAGMVAEPAAVSSKPKEPTDRQ